MTKNTTVNIWDLRANGGEPNSAPHPDTSTTTTTIDPNGDGGPDGQGEYTTTTTTGIIYKNKAGSGAAERPRSLGCGRGVAPWAQRA